jgi:hypothetical protein
MRIAAADANAAFRDIFLPSLDLRLECVGQFEAVFQKLLQPSAKLRLFLRRERADIGLDLLQRDA